MVPPGHQVGSPILRIGSLVRRNDFCASLVIQVSRRRIAAYGLLAATAGLFYLLFLGNPPVIDRCDRYLPTDQPLIAHAGGGMPGAIYTNSMEAMEIAAAHGFHMIELDFWRTRKGLAMGHDPQHLSPMTFEQLLDFLRRHPGISIVTDFKTDNILGLQRLAELAGPMRNRFIPQIYSLDELDPATAMGFPKPILTAYRLLNFGWLFNANSADVRAVTMPYRHRFLARFIDHPVFLNTVNEPVHGYGLYTDCLIPASVS
jgi:hypothetical protein